MLRFFSLLLCTALYSLPVRAHAQELWSTTELKTLCTRLQPVSNSTLSQTLGPFQTTLRDADHLSAGRLRTLTYADLEPLLSLAAQQHWSVLEVFSQAAFANPGGCALFMDRHTLAEAHARFDLHGVWQLAATLADDASQILPMEYMIVGLGRLVVGYPRAATIAINEGEAISGNYDYAPYFSARIANSPRDRGLLDIRALTKPDGEFGPFTGPYGAQIRELTLRDGSIMVKFTLGWEQERRARNVAISTRGQLALAR